jgi:hypothetical protein
LLCPSCLGGLVANNCCTATTERGPPIDS